VIAGHPIYAVDLSDEPVVVQASDAFRFLTRNRLGQALQSPPAIAAGCMIFRIEGFLMALGAKWLDLGACKWSGNPPE
jgi:hypothetical protein